MDLGRRSYERFARLAAEVGGLLDKAHNKSVVTLESRVLVPARKLRDLKAGPEDADIGATEPVERTARALQAQDMALVPVAEERP
jgi:DNA recombination protein RmuC